MSRTCNAMCSEGHHNGGAKLSFPWSQHADLPMPLAQIIRIHSWHCGFPSGMAVATWFQQYLRCPSCIMLKLIPTMLDSRSQASAPVPGCYHVPCVFLPKSTSQWGVFDGFQQHLSIKFGIIATKAGKVIRACFYPFVSKLKKNLAYTVPRWACLWIQHGPSGILAGLDCFYPNSKHLDVRCKKDRNGNRVAAHFGPAQSFVETIANLKNITNT